MLPVYVVAQHDDENQANFLPVDLHLFCKLVLLAFAGPAVVLLSVCEAGIALGIKSTIRFVTVSCKAKSWSTMRYSSSLGSRGRFNSTVGGVDCKGTP